MRREFFILANVNETQRMLRFETLVAQRIIPQIRQFLARNHRIALIRLFEHVLFGVLFAVIVEARRFQHELPFPHAPVTPHDVVPHQLLRVWNAAILREGNQLARVRVAQRLDEPRRLRRVHMLAGVNVLADDIHILVARLPRGILTVPDPNQVVQPVDVRQALVHEFVQLQVRWSGFQSRIDSQRKMTRSISEK